MDIEYLLYLQQFRETVGSILTPLMNAVTKLSAGFLPIAMKVSFKNPLINRPHPSPARIFRPVFRSNAQ